jgi:hypothetical protein
MQQPVSIVLMPGQYLTPVLLFTLQYFALRNSESEFAFGRTKVAEISDIHISRLLPPDIFSSLYPQGCWCINRL